MYLTGVGHVDFVTWILIVTFHCAIATKKEKMKLAWICKQAL